MINDFNEKNNEVNVCSEDNNSQSNVCEEKLNENDFYESYSSNNQDVIKKETENVKLINDSETKSQNLSNNATGSIHDRKQDLEINNDKDSTQQTKNDETKDKYRQLAFWVSLLCIIVVGVEIVLNSLGVNFEVKLTVEIISYVLAFLVSIGVLKSNKKNNNIEDLKNDIENEIMSSTNIENSNKEIKKENSNNEKEDSNDKI